MYWLPRTALTRFSVAWYLRANAQARRPRRLAAWPPAQSCRPSCRRSTGNRSPYVSMTPSWALRFGRRGAFLCALLCGSGCCPDSLWAWGGYQLQRCHLPPQPSRCELLFIAYTPCASAHSGSRTTAPQTKRPVSRFKKRRSRGCNRSPFSHFVLIFYIVFSVDVLLANCRCRCPRPKSTTTSPTTTTTVRWTRARPRARWVIPRASGPRAAPSRWVTSWTGATHNHKRYPHLLCVPKKKKELRAPCVLNYTPRFLVLTLFGPRPYHVLIIYIARVSFYSINRLSGSRSNIDLPPASSSAHERSLRRGYRSGVPSHCPASTRIPPRIRGLSSAVQAMPFVAANSHKLANRPAFCRRQFSKSTAHALCVRVPYLRLSPSVNTQCCPP